MTSIQHRNPIGLHASDYKGEEKRCGTCRWSRLLTETKGWCKYPLPYWVSCSSEDELCNQIYKDDDMNCYCWEVEK